MRIYRIEFGDATLILDDLEAAVEEARIFCEEMKDGESFTIEIDEMDEEEYENLPEFKGW